MKLIPTSSQTVGPFFSIGLAPLCQDVEATLASSPDSILLRGVVLDGNRAPIPDCVLEFFVADFFARVATSADGNYRVAVATDTNMCEVLVFMRGLLKPTLTRIYLNDEALKGDPAVQNVPVERRTTLLARRTGGECEWNVTMQGEDETVFFDF